MPLTRRLVMKTARALDALAKSAMSFCGSATLRVGLGANLGAKGVVIGQLLLLILGGGALASLAWQSFLLAYLWALVLIFFAFAASLVWSIARFEHRIGYYAGARA